jgi:hypothetical protein
MAGKLNPQYIDGLDMAQSTPEGFRKLTEVELRELSRQSAELHSHTKKWLLGAVPS